MELEVRHLRVVCAVADAGSLRKAARTLGMSQPALTTQLNRIEKALGGRLFSRSQLGSHPTPLGRTVLNNARSLVDGLDALVAEARTMARRVPGPGMRLGSTYSNATMGWLRRVRERMPETEVTIYIDGSAGPLLQLLEDGLLDAVFVHEVEGSPLRLPPNADVRVLVEREPVFIALSCDHPAARGPTTRLVEVAADRWMLDLSIQDEWAGVQRMFARAGLPEPAVAHSSDQQIIAELICAGEVVSPCRPTSGGRPGMAVRPMQGDPLATRLLLVISPSQPNPDALSKDLQLAYSQSAWSSPTYRKWLESNGHPTPIPSNLTKQPKPTQLIGPGRPGRQA